MPITINDCRNCNKPPMILKVAEHLNEEFELACGECGQETETFDEEAIEEWNTANPVRQDMAIAINNCKCGGHPRFETNGSGSCDTCDFYEYYFRCSVCRHEIEPEGTFERAVALWNEANEVAVPKASTPVEVGGERDALFGWLKEETCR